MKIQYYRLRGKGLNSFSVREYMNTKEPNNHQCTIRKMIWIFMFLCVICVCVVNVFNIQTYTGLTQQNMFIFERQYPGQLEELPGFLIKNPGCRIPYMDPFDPSILNCFFDEDTPDCNYGVPAMYGSNKTSIFFIQSSFEAFRFLNTSTFSCCYKPFWRKRPNDNEPDESVDFGRECIPVGDSARISDEFIRVTCGVEGIDIYEDYFSFIQPKEYTKPVTNRKPSQAPLNVLMIGLDGMSRMNLHRQLQSTVNYLHNISAVELLGYNKVADNTFPNVIPILTGQYEENIMQTCYEATGRFDTCPLVWNLYKKVGFVTAFGEDASRLGIFNYERNGFDHQPTDYMWGAFERLVEKRIGNQGTMNVNPCMGSRFVYRVLLNHIDDFTETMHQVHRRYFAFYWGSTLTHDYLNMPKLGDEHFKAFFEKLYESGRLNNTALFFISDHGIRYGDIRQTYLGRLEERLPFVFVVLPSWFKQKYSLSYRNLKRNVRRLTTPFDLHETLVHLANFSEASEDWSAGWQKHGYSLFTNIPSTRTCDDAGIPAHWCTCQQSFKIKRNSSMVQDVAHAIVHHMNVQLRGYAQCAVLVLKAVLDARMMAHQDNILTGDVIYKDYIVTVQTEPGNGIFESTVRHHTGQFNGGFEITGTVSRLNLYGNQSLCITDFHLKLYCYCKSVLKSLIEHRRTVS